MHGQQKEQSVEVPGWNYALNLFTWLARWHERRTVHKRSGHCEQPSVNTPRSYSTSSTDRLVDTWQRTSRHLPSHCRETQNAPSLLSMALLS